MAEKRQGLYRRQAEKYWENGYGLLAFGDTEKAAELFWGAMAQAIKGVAARKGVALRRHGQVRQFARTLAKELEDPTLWHAFVNAEHLHTDFYEVNLSAEDVVAITEGLKPAIKKLFDLMEEPLPTTPLSLKRMR